MIFMEKDKKVALCFLAASIIAPTAVFVTVIASGMNLGDAFLYGIGAYTALPLLILLVYIWMSRNAPRKTRVCTIIAIPVITGALVIACAISSLVVLGSGSVSANIDDKGLEVSAPFVDEKISYQDIDSVELRNDVDYGSRRAGYAGKNLLSGNFRNDEFGNYKLAIHRSTSECIVVHHSSGILLFNLDSSDDTERFYDDLSSRIPETWHSQQEGEN